MRVLLVVFVLSLAALIWTLLALTRHIRKHDAQPVNPQLAGTQHEDSLKQSD
jgi:hypothetical protein